MINKRYSIISLSKMIRDDDDEMRGDHFHDDDIRQHEHNVYHGYATWYPSSGPLYNISDYILYVYTIKYNFPRLIVRFLKIEHLMFIPTC